LLQGAGYKGTVIKPVACSCIFFLPLFPGCLLKRLLMSLFNSVSRSSRSIINTMQSYVDDHPFVDEEVFTMMQGLQHMFPQWVLTTCPVKHPEIRFITSNCRVIFGYTSEYLTRQNSTFFSYIFEEDHEDLKKCFAFIDEFLKNCLPETYPFLRCVFHYRFMHGNGRVITVRDEKATMRMENNSRFYYSILKDVSQEVVFSGAKVEIFRQDEVLEKLAEYKPSAEKTKMSKREHELIALLQRGFTTKEMAHYMGISPHTVRNLRQKMFEKYKVNNAIELLNRAVPSHGQVSS
jgi:DNA-binding CsgD family transcriptional regulator